jgi:hypothetical protein
MVKLDSGAGQSLGWMIVLVKQFPVNAALVYPCLWLCW